MQNLRIVAKIGLPKGSGKWLKVREKSVKSQGILKWILSGNPAKWIAEICILMDSSFWFDTINLG